MSNLPQPKGFLGPFDANREPGLSLSLRKDWSGPDSGELARGLHGESGICFEGRKAMKGAHAPKRAEKAQAQTRPAGIQHMDPELYELVRLAVRYLQAAQRRAVTNPS